MSQYYRNISKTANTVSLSAASSMDSYLKSKMLKMHDDDYPNVHFNIQLFDDNGNNDYELQQEQIENNNEVQTIPSKRYRKVRSDDNDSATLTNSLSNTSLSKNEDRQHIELFTNIIYQLLIEPIMAAT